MSNPLTKITGSGGQPFSGIKYLVIIMMGLLLLIPLGMIRGLVEERRMRKLEVSREIRDLWGGLQTLAGPYLTIPYTYRYDDAEGIERKSQSLIYLMPEELRINGKLIPESRSRGIYSVSLFMAELVLEGSFRLPTPEELGLEAEDLLLERVRFVIGGSRFPGGARRRSPELGWYRPPFRAGGGPDGPLFRCSLGPGAAGSCRRKERAELHGRYEARLRRFIELRSRRTPDDG